MPAEALILSLGSNGKIVLSAKAIDVRGSLFSLIEKAGSLYTDPNKAADFQVT